ncbi:probable ubiquitin-like-specific protease 2A isoform X2 [Physcomitrium patens]|uniref:probable ubiquitin-like-specific protease 2A isoform X2 n=1 Tax=Physcomitrium patens TaxID=3218 RepID=UPI000D15CEEA|nr:probable ubiquitin-like-specific protease 2B isoform X2 [Physcomitrium patens]|eukprot:XP_024396576.1 probable ubiquitin-like-specific protease 2B isoform X2 [Physcomitrella patens]
MFDRGSRSKKIEVAKGVDISAFNFEMELEEERVPSTTYQSGFHNYFFPAVERHTQRLGMSEDENQQISSSSCTSKQEMPRNKEFTSFSNSNQVIVTASRARLNQHYGRFVTVIFSAKHVEVKQAKEILSRKWQREDLCVFKSFYKFHVENADEKALIVLLLHKRRVFGRCSNYECTNPSDLTESLVMEIKNDTWKDQQRQIFELSRGYREVWKRIEIEEMLKYKKKLSRNPFEELSLNRSLIRNPEPDISGEMFSPSDRLKPESRTFETLVYPPGDPDAVTITSKDVDVLRPVGFLNDTIIDFYIKYLQNQLSSKDLGRFYFFNSFFFRKLVDSSNKYTGPDRGKVVYDTVRKWTRKVSLFEKDYVFIPVNQSLHWSLIIVCHLGALRSTPDEGRGTPCILHLDSMEGNHDDIEEHIRNYIVQAWMEEHQSSANHSASKEIISQMKYKVATVPQQINHCDCGIYLLHYVELFLKEAPKHFNLASFEGFPYFLTRTWFKSSEVSAKRSAIRNLLMQLHEGSPSSGSDVQTTPQQRAQELQVTDENDRSIPSSSKTIHTDLVVSLQVQIQEEVHSARMQCTLPEGGVSIEATIVDLHSDDDAVEESPVCDSRTLDFTDEKYSPSSSTSAHLHITSPVASKNTPIVPNRSHGVIGSNDSERLSHSADLVVLGKQRHPFPLDCDANVKRKLRRV